MDDNLIQYNFGSDEPEWGSGTAQNLQFIVTENCNLRCSYCYINHVSNGERMSFEVAKKFIDYFIDGLHYEPLKPNVIIDFIGGEPFLEIELIDKITDYFKWKCYISNHDWYWNYRISISTNGVYYGTTAVQRYIQKNDGKISISITIDGVKEKHDMHRVFVNGSGSYDKVVKNIPHYIENFYPTTKVTFAHGDLALLKDSIIHLWNLGIIDVTANVVFENAWEDGDDKLFEKQLCLLADYVIENDLHHKFFCSLFSDHIGAPYHGDDLRKTSCGAGKMLAVGPNGKIYPCLRYKKYSLGNKDEWVIGDVDHGIDREKIRPFMSAMYSYQSDKECLECIVASGCGFCQGFNYDAADTDTNFQRAKYICKMHKARVRANNYYWARLYNEKGIERANYRNETQKMYFVLSDDYIDFCEVHSETTSKRVMERDKIEQGLQYSHENFFSPVFLHSESNPQFNLFTDFPSYRIMHIISAKFAHNVEPFRNYFLVYTKDDLADISKHKHQDSVILNVRWDEVHNLYSYVSTLFEIADRINLNMSEVTKNVNLTVYRQQLMKIRDYLVNSWENDTFKEFNRITDIFYEKKQESCLAGSKAFAYAPDGKIYVCPHQYSGGMEPVGDVLKGLWAKNLHLYAYEYAPLCELCEANQCVRCSYVNKSTTNEVNVPPSYKCAISLVERNISNEFSISLPERFKLKVLSNYNYMDPLDALLDYNGRRGFYASVIEETAVTS
jgi:radical SAM peptide maturase (CXXX-repeat target family)/CXXX repeat peptide maturase